jgi:hypothetical protein
MKERFILFLAIILTFSLTSTGYAIHLCQFLTKRFFFFTSLYRIVSSDSNFHLIGTNYLK